MNHSGQTLHTTARLPKQVTVSSWQRFRTMVRISNFRQARAFFLAVELTSEPPSGSTARFVTTLHLGLRGLRF